MPIATTHAMCICIHYKCIEILKLFLESTFLSYQSHSLTCFIHRPLRTIDCRLKSICDPVSILFINTVTLTKFETLNHLRIGKLSLIQLEY